MFCRCYVKYDKNGSGQMLNKVGYVPIVLLLFVAASKSRQRLKLCSNNLKFG